MITTPVLFYIFSAVLLFASFRVITARSPVYAALYLVLAFFSASCVWMLLRAEFLSIALILVYVGAVMVLFLFVVMMLDINTDTLREGFWKHAPVAGAVGLIIALEMAAVLIPGFNLPSAPTPDAADLKLGNTKMLGIEIYTEYLFPLRHHRCDRPDAAPAQGHQANQPIRSGSGQEGRPGASGQDAAYGRT